MSSPPVAVPAGPHLVPDTCLTRIAGGKYRDLAEPGPERQNGWVYSVGGGG
jgi:hypothetical protein